MDSRGAEDERLATWEGTGEGSGGGLSCGDDPTEPSLLFGLLRLLLAGECRLAALTLLALATTRALITRLDPPPPRSSR